MFKKREKKSTTLIFPEDSNDYSKSKISNKTKIKNHFLK